MLDILHSKHKDRTQTEQFIQSVFIQTYGAHIRYFMQYLIRLRYDKTGTCYSVAGYNEAGLGMLFVEQYLDQTIEFELSQKTGGLVNRNLIVEVGNLAEVGPGGARDIIIALISFLSGAGFQWGVVTAVPKLSNAFHRLGLEWVDLGLADPNVLSVDERTSWGTYYDQKPIVRAANLLKSYRVLQNKRGLPDYCRELIDKAYQMGKKKYIAQKINTCKNSQSCL